MKIGLSLSLMGLWAVQLRGLPGSSEGIKTTPDGALLLFKTADGSKGVLKYRAQGNDS